jgi:hypothetical protein
MADGVAGVLPRTLAQLEVALRAGIEAQIFPAPCEADRLSALNGYHRAHRHGGRAEADHLGWELRGPFLVCTTCPNEPTLERHRAAVLAHVARFGHLVRAEVRKAASR